MSKTTNVLFISHSGSFGGAQKSLLALINYLGPKKSFRPYFVFGSRGDFFEHIKKRGYKTFEFILLRCTRYNFGFKKTLWFIFNFYHGIFLICRIIKKNNIEIVHTNTIFNFQGAIAAKLMNVRHIWHVREDISLPYFDFLISSELLIKFISYFSDWIICISEVEARLFSHNSKKSIIYNTWQVDPSQKAQPGKLVSDGKEETVIFAQFGSIFPNKNQIWFVESFIELCKEFNNCKAYLIGKKIEKHKDYFFKIINTIEASGFDKRIKILPYTNDIDSWYKKIDVQVNPMLRGIIGRITIESMSYGIPCVGTCDNINQGIVDDGLNGSLVNFDNKLQLKNAMARLMDYNNRLKLGKNAFNKSKNILNNEIYGSSISKIYNELL
jgi:glycosyltransferase involved in cell wall biosynthesis